MPGMPYCPTYRVHPLFDPSQDKEVPVVMTSPSIRLGHRFAHPDVFRKNHMLMVLPIPIVPISFWGTTRAKLLPVLEQTPIAQGIIAHRPDPGLGTATTDGQTTAHSLGQAGVTPVTGLIAATMLSSAWGSSSPKTISLYPTAM